MRTHLLTALSAISTLVSAQGSTRPPLFIAEPVNLVNPFIGTTNGGHVFPGATLPHGMAKVGMDTDSPGRQAGYDANPEFLVTGFSQLHDSGTGGGIPLSNFKLWPYAQCDSFGTCPTAIDQRKVARKLLANGAPDDAASPGYFATNLSTNIRVELSATRRTAIHRYTFPRNTTHPRLLLDIGNDGTQTCTFPFINIDSSTGRMTGGGEYVSSFGPERYKVFVCADFKGDGYDLGAPTEFGAYTGNNAINQTKHLTQVYFGGEFGGLLGFRRNPTASSSSRILARVGVSFISSDQACRTAEAEIPDFDFEGVHTAARNEWNELLGRIQVNPAGVDNETVSLFYSSFYRTHISPADYTDENPDWNSTEPYYDSIYCNWDTYRTLYPFFSLHDPVRFANIVRGFLNIQQHEGWLPECRGATTRQYIQGGSNGDPILGEFFVKFQNFSDSLGVSPDALYAALVQDAEVQPPDWDLAGRQANLWKQLGYIPSDIWEESGTNTKQVSRTLEHSFNDFTISQVARLLGRTDDAQKYATRARNFNNVWNPDITVPGANNSIKGMMQPKFSNGQFNFTDPRHCSAQDPTDSTCFLDARNTDGFYEGSPLIYSQYVPHDTAALINLQGGNSSFSDRIDFVIDENFFESTNEPSQQIPYMYHYVDQPGKSTQRSRQVITKDFNTSVNGLPGNDDSGAMGSYAAYYLLGMYPLPATRQTLLASPYFPEINFFNPLFNTTTVIRVTNFAGNPSNGTGQVFVANATIDGVAAPSTCFLEWDVFEKGSVVELTLTDNIDVTCNGALPPSLSTGGYGPVS